MFDFNGREMQKHRMNWVEGKNLLSKCLRRAFRLNLYVAAAIWNGGHGILPVRDNWYNYSHTSNASNVSLVSIGCVCKYMCKLKLLRQAAYKFAGGGRGRAEFYDVVRARLI